MKVAVGFHNGIGNFVLFTSAIESIVKLAGEKVDLFLDGFWEGWLSDAIVEIGMNHPCISKVEKYYEDTDLSNYDKLYMSCHNHFDNLRARFHKGRSFDLKRIDHQWAYGDLLHEIEFYDMEIREDFDYKGNISDQNLYYEYVYGYEKSICISNGWLRSDSNYWERRGYPHWEGVIENILKYYRKVDIVLIGGTDDMEWANGIENSIISERVRNLTGKTNIQETINIIQSSIGLISTDTGVMHIADALRKPGIVLFGSTLVSKSGPWNGTVKVVKSPIHCAPCHRTPVYEVCDHPLDCMSAIDPSIVFFEIRKVFSDLI